MSRGATPAVIVKIRRLGHGRELPLPEYESAAAAGVDLLAAVATDQPMVIAPGHHTELPPGTEAQVRPRSGLAARHGVTVLNSPGTIDADYRGEVSVILINHGAAPFKISRGDRIAQLIVAPVAQAILEVTTNLSETARGTGGFGSTGIGEQKSSKGASKGKPVPRKAHEPKSQATIGKRSASPPKAKGKRRR